MSSLYVPLPPRLLLGDGATPSLVSLYAAVASVCEFNSPRTGTISRRRLSLRSAVAKGKLTETLTELVLRNLVRIERESHSANQYELCDDTIQDSAQTVAALLEGRLGRPVRGRGVADERLFEIRIPMRLMHQIEQHRSEGSPTTPSVLRASVSVYAALHLLDLHDSDLTPNRETLQDLSGVSNNQTLQYARDFLRVEGFIDYTPGRGGAASSFSLRDQTLEGYPRGVSETSVTTLPSNDTAGLSAPVTAGSPGPDPALGPDSGRVGTVTGTVPVTVTPSDPFQRSPIFQSFQDDDHLFGRVLSNLSQALEDLAARVGTEMTRMTVNVQLDVLEELLGGRSSAASPGTQTPFQQLQPDLEVMASPSDETPSSEILEEARRRLETQKRAGKSISSESAYLRSIVVNLTAEASNVDQRVWAHLWKVANSPATFRSLPVPPWWESEANSEHRSILSGLFSRLDQPLDERRSWLEARAPNTTPQR